MAKDFRTTTPPLALVLETVQLCLVVLGQADTKRKIGTSQSTYMQQGLIYVHTVKTYTIKVSFL